MKTYNDVQALLDSLVIPFTTNNGGVTLYETGSQVFSTDYPHQFFNFRIKATGFAKYVQHTHLSSTSLSWDLLYHWLDDFQSISSFEALRERITDVTLCGSFATTIAVNKYVDAHSPTPKQLVELFAGSKWRWTKTPMGEYVQKSLYAFNEEGLTEFYRYNQGIFTTNSALLISLKSLSSLIRNNALVVHNDRVAREEIANTTLRAYNYRATESFGFKQGKEAKYRTFLGIELELENHSVAEFKTLNILKEHAIFKRDGSLDGGVEICTAPATLDVHKEAFSKFFDGFGTNKSKLKAKDNCGMHIHIDKAKLSSLHIANLCFLLNKKENEEVITAIAGRSANRYCRTHEYSYQDFVGNKRHGDRYKRVNLEPSATVELRMFASTTNFNDFCKRLEFTQAVVDFTRPGETNLSCKQTADWQLFKAYVAENKHNYPVLVKNM